MQAYYSVRDLSQRWRCSRTAVMYKLRSANATVMDFSPGRGKRGKKLVSGSVVKQLETKWTKTLR
jgi:hypothetical protein